MRVVTFPKGMMVRHAIKWMVIEHDRGARVYISAGRIRRLSMDMTYPHEADVDWLQAAHDLAFAYGLVLWQDHLKIWRVRPFVWSRDKEMFRERRDRW